MIASTFRGELLRGDSWLGRDFTGQRVAVIAPGADAARIVPHVARSAAAVKVFLSSPAWILPRPGGPAGVLFRAGTRAPVARRIAARVHLRRSVSDSWMRRRLTPDLRFDRPGATTAPAFYRALREDNCTLVTWPVYALVSHGVRTAEGIEHQTDVIIVGDGIDIVAADREEDIA